MNPAQFVENYCVARLLLKQRLERKHRNLGPARRERCLLQEQIGLAMAWLVFQNFFDHFHSVSWIPFQFTLRLQDGNGGSREAEKRLFPALPAEDLRAAQNLAAREKFRLLFQDALQKRNRVVEIAQLDRGHRLEPMAA